MNEFAGAVDLAQFKGTLGPKESEALLTELRDVMRTREIALRGQAAAEAENDGLHRLLAAIAYTHGQPEGAGRRSLKVSAAQYADAEEAVVSCGIIPGDDGLEVQCSIRVDGDWAVKDQPTDQQRSQLDVYEDLPTIVTRAEPFEIIVNTKKGLRVAEWTPRP